MMSSSSYCWPCFGIIANVGVGNDLSNINSGYWMRKFSDFKPLRIAIFLNEDQGTEHVLLTFKSDWSGFKNAMEFEKSFEGRGRSRGEWIHRKTSPGSRLYGWVAREDDYKADDPLGEFLRGNVALKTVQQLLKEATANRGKILCDLVNEIESRNKNLNQLRDNYVNNRMSPTEMLQEQDKMYRTFDEATLKLQCITREHITGIADEQEMLKFELENERQRSDSWRKDLNNREEALNEREVRILEAENIMIELRKREEALNEREGRILQAENMMIEVRKREEALVEREKQIVEVENQKSDMIAEERRKANENAIELIQVLKREKEAIEMEGKLDEKQKLELEIEELKDQMNGLQNMSRDLTIKERQCNDELQGARNELMKGMNDMTIGFRAKIGIKRMGEIDPKAFKKACKQRFTPEDSETKALELCSLWQENLRNPHWHPFRVVKNGTGIHQALLNEDDELLRGLKDEWGEEIYDAVVTALKDIHEYNPSGCYSVSEFWNFKENKKATLKEVIGYICTQLKTLKRKRGV